VCPGYPRGVSGLQLPTQPASNPQVGRLQLPSPPVTISSEDGEGWGWISQWEPASEATVPWAGGYSPAWCHLVLTLHLLLGPTCTGATWHWAGLQRLQQARTRGKTGGLGKSPHLPLQT
jgi:hypothetical protein